MEKRLLAILRLAIKYNATDIHFTQRYNEMLIQMRIDGEIKNVKSCQEDYKLLRYLQYLANLDVGKLLDPQTGQFEIEVDGSLLSLRFAVINSTNYTNGVLRILNSNLKIDAMHLSSLENQNKYFNSLLDVDCGLVIFSGPTGSGKTTSLYTLLNKTKNKKIFTIEDPIEVYNDNFVQLQINEAIGFDYNEGIKQILRHDPDIIMIGEIRDEKAAKMAVVAANTGHLVLTTIHASSASSVITRLIELGVSKSHIYENLICIANQRMLNKKNEKKVIYEIMDNEEINYFKNNNMNSKNFLSINKQIEKEKNNGFI